MRKKHQVRERGREGDRAREETVESRYVSRMKSTASWVPGVRWLKELERSCYSIRIVVQWWHKWPDGGR